MGRWWTSSITALLALTAWHPSQAQSVQVYRCTAADGSVALQDSPCAKSAGQELRTLKRPPEAPPAPTPEEGVEGEPAADAPPPESLPEPEPEPAPMPTLYECVTHDGQRYQNETGIGEMRWVPLWVIGMGPDAPKRTGAKPAAAPQGSQPRAPATAPDAKSLGAGTWIRDTCYELQPDKICERQRERLDELRRKRRQVTASERLPIDAEYTRVSAQYSAYCGG